MSKHTKKYEHHYYLEKLGIPIERCGTNFCDNKDRRYKKWMKERKKYGFDSRETWCLSEMFNQWLYERLKLYKKKASKIVDLKWHKFTIKGKEYTQLQCINQMIKDLEYILTHDEIDDKSEKDYKKRQKKQDRIFLIWSTVFPTMWW